MKDILKIKVERYDNMILGGYVAYVDESDLLTSDHRFTGLVVQGNTALEAIAELHQSLLVWEKYKNRKV